jgi:outer membrane immunogenic protein
MSGAKSLSRAGRPQSWAAVVAGALASACTLALPPTALADPPTYGWSGAYAGLHAGYGWGHNKAHLVSVLDGVPMSLPSLELEEIPSTYRFNSSGILGGWQAGINQQIGRLVLGIEADGSYTGLKGDTTATGLVTSGTPATTSTFISTQSHRMNWLATLRARFGYTPSKALLLYATGGLAVGNVTDSVLLQFISTGGSTFFGARSVTLAGWTAGAGAEYRLSRNWTAKVEYLYFDLGNTTISGRDVRFPNQPFQEQSRFDHSGHIVRIGVNYRFGAPTADR